MSRVSPGRADDEFVGGEDLCGAEAVKRNAVPANMGPECAEQEAAHLDAELERGALLALAAV